MASNQQQQQQQQHQNAHSHHVSSFHLLNRQHLLNEIKQKCIEKDKYIEKLEQLLQEHHIELPILNDPLASAAVSPTMRASFSMKTLLASGNIEEISATLERNKTLVRKIHFPIEYYDLTYSTTVTSKNPSIESVSSLVNSIVCFCQSKKEKKVVDILAQVTGRIQPGKMTLLMGPPASGKSGKYFSFLHMYYSTVFFKIHLIFFVVFLKALAGRLRNLGHAKLTGEIYYDGDNIKSKKFLAPKVADYIEQGDTLEAALSVEETLQFAWNCTTGGHHSYARAKDEHAIEALDNLDASNTLVVNMLTVLGLKGCKGTYVGNAMIRGISGGQKRRVTIGEMAVCPRPVSWMCFVSFCAFDNSQPVV